MGKLGVELKEVDYASCFKAILGFYNDPKAVSDLKKEKAEINLATKVYETLKNDKNIAILTAILEEDGLSFGKVCKGLKIGPLTTDILLQNMKGLGLVGKYFRQDNGYQAYYKLTRYSKILLEEVFGITRETAKDYLGKFQTGNLKEIIKERIPQFS